MGQKWQWICHILRRSNLIIAFFGILWEKFFPEVIGSAIKWMADTGVPKVLNKRSAVEFTFFGR